MVLKFEDYINESLWKKAIERSKTGEIRKEEGKYVKTSLGFDILLHNPNFDYESLIKEILNNSEDDPMGISISGLGLFNSKIQQRIKKGEEPYIQMINGSYAAGFDSYHDVIDDGMYDMDGLDEHDYLEIINAIVEKMRTVVVEKSKGSYDSKYYLCLMDEGTMWNYECNMNESTRDYYWDDFKMWFEDEFGDVELETWSYNNYGDNLGIEINYDNVMNFQEMKEKVDDYFNWIVENQEEDNEDEE